MSAVKEIKMTNQIDEQPEDYNEYCKICSGLIEHIECWNCGGNGYSEDFHDCGEDCCCCIDPEPGECPECHGRGYFKHCLDSENHKNILLTIKEKQSKIET
jgi:hypothetical protein